VSETRATQEIKINIPNSLLSEIDGFAKQKRLERDELICQATKMYLKEMKKRHFREIMRRGYMEMAKINLDLASEAIHAEYEAEHTVERLVNGG